MTQSDLDFTEKIAKKILEYARIGYDEDLIKELNDLKVEYVRCITAQVDENSYETREIQLKLIRQRFKELTKTEEPKKDESDFIYGMPRSMNLESARMTLEQAEFKRTREYFISRIKREIQHLRNVRTPELAEANAFYAERYEQILSLPLNDYDDIEKAEWLFNNGALRTDKEISDREERERIAEIRASKEYNDHHHPFLCYVITFFLLPVIESLTLCRGNLSGEFLLGILLTFAYGMIPNLIIAAVVTLVYEKMRSVDYDVPMDSAVVEAVAGATVAGITSYKIADKVNQRERKSRSKEI